MADIFSKENAFKAWDILKKKAGNAISKAGSAVRVSFDPGRPYANGAALTPPMGWSSWNTFSSNINEKLILETADAMKKSGLADCGYRYINLDDCWMSSVRDSDGRLCGDPDSFPGGIASLVEKLNAMGFKAGIYSSNGTLTCDDLPASLGNEAIDADTFAEWGIEYLKYDFGHNVPIPSGAPDIEMITVSIPGSDEKIIKNASDAQLFGKCELISEDGKEYITGLSSNAGSCEFSGIYADEETETELSLFIKKIRGGAKYLELLINNHFRYKINFPKITGYSHSGKFIVKIKLHKGENTFEFYNPVGSIFDSAAIQYTDMGRELKRAAKEAAEKTGKAEKPIVYSICEWGRDMPWKWGSSAGNLWRTTPDIKPFWISVLGIYEVNVLLDKHAAPGGWNDPDMLEVGNGNLTFEENKSHFSLWCMMAAPLILGNDVRKFVLPDGAPDFGNDILGILSNKNLIAVDQDPLGIQCIRYKTMGIEDILVKPLENNEIAVCFFNKFSRPSNMTASIRKIVCEPYVSTPLEDEYEVTDLWSDECFTVNDILSTSVPSHGVKVFRIRVK